MTAEEIIKGYAALAKTPGVIPDGLIRIASLAVYLLREWIDGYEYMPTDHNIDTCDCLCCTTKRFLDGPQ